MNFLSTTELFHLCLLKSESCYLERENTRCKSQCLGQFCFILIPYFKSSATNYFLEFQA